MKRSEINQPPCYFDKYIGLVDDVDITDAFELSIAEIDQIDADRLGAVGKRVYEPGKWTVNDVFRHLIDAEHVLRYRALRIGRNDPTELPGFDEALFAANTDTSTVGLKELIDELRITRLGTERLFRSFDREALLRSAVINGNRMSSLAYGFAMIGHQKYHLEIIRERYLPLV